MDAVASYTCECPPAWTGHRCDRGKLGVHTRDSLTVLAIENWISLLNMSICEHFGDY